MGLYESVAFKKHNKIFDKILARITLELLSSFGVIVKVIKNSNKIK